MNEMCQVVSQKGQRVVFEGTKAECFAVVRYSNSYAIMSDFYVRALPQADASHA